MRIYLTGMMGSGKSFWAHHLAAKYNLESADLDAEIERETGITIGEIFALKGEDFFRKKEQEILYSLSSKQRIVIATGGGTPCFHNNINWMNAHGITTWIDEEIKVLAERLKPEKWHRPLIKNLNDDELKKFLSGKLQERKFFYAQAQYHLHGKNITEKSFTEILDKHV